MAGPWLHLRRWLVLEKKRNGYEQMVYWSLYILNTATTPKVTVHTNPRVFNPMGPKTFVRANCDRVLGTITPDMCDTVSREVKKNAFEYDDYHHFARLDFLFSTVTVKWSKCLLWYAWVLWHSNPRIRLCGQPLLFHYMIDVAYTNKTLADKPLPNEFQKQKEFTKSLYLVYWHKLKSSIYANERA